MLKASQNGELTKVAPFRVVAESVEPAGQMMNTPKRPAVPFTVVVPTIYGQMLVNRHDINQANSLFKTGRSVDHEEISMLAELLKSLGTDLTVIDVGANFGTFSLALSRAVGLNGQVHAFEPQRLIYNLMVGSIALNSLSNVHSYNMALGNHEGKVEIPQFDYFRPMNFGSVEFTPNQSEPLPQVREHNLARVEYVRLTTIDNFKFPAVHLMKIDVEGMELEVLQGSSATIERCRLVLFIEHLKSDKTKLAEFIHGFKYNVHAKGINLLCVPVERTAIAKF